jgi:2-deoxy-D-gluconate 3-dehydrogenase
MSKLFDLTGAVAFVTGGNGGIGKGIALGLAEAGATVAIAARNEAKTAEAVAAVRAVGGHAIGVRCDVTDERQIDEAVRQAVQALGPITVRVNNSGIGVRGLPHELSHEDWRRVLATNLDAPFSVAQACYPHMKRAGWGKVINIASGYSFFGGTMNPAYSTSKGGIVQLTRSLANAWGKDNIQVNAIAPGYIQTELTERIQGTALHDLLIGRTPAGRHGVPADMAGPAVFLASRASDFVTGAVIVADGGMTVADVTQVFPLA